MNGDGGSSLSDGVEATDPLGGSDDLAFKVPPNYNWNIFRYIADYLHLFGIAVLIYTLFKNKNCRGLSLKTQILYFLIFITRYLDLLEHAQTRYLVFFKLTYILSSLGTLVAFYVFSKWGPLSYEQDKDTLRMEAIIIPCIIAAFVLSKQKSFLEIAWTFSEYLEGFAMAPQYVFCYRETAQTLMREPGVLLYIVSLGGYRIFYAFNWMYKLYMDPTYRDPQSWLGGLIEILLFVDFLCYQFQHWSVLRSLVLTFDDKVNEVVDKVELKVFPSQADRFEKHKTEMTEMRQRRVVGNPDYAVVEMQDQL